MRRLVFLCLLISAPAWGQGAPPATSLDHSLAALKIAPTEESAQALESHIHQQWIDAASPAVKLLLARGVRELNEGAANDAADSFDAALDLESNLVAAWHGRAQARFRLGDTAGAIRDIQETLKREPRHFAALEDLSHIAESRGDWKGALAAWNKVLEIDPKTPNGQVRLKDLRRRALGEAL